MKILVTGATGFIGGHLTERLVREGHAVTALVRSGSDTTLLESLGVALARGDLGDYPSLEAAVRGQEVVYHLAAAVSQSAPSRAAYRATNTLGTDRLVRAVVARGVKHLVYCSSVAVHGTPATCPADERAPLRPDYFIYRTKIEGERLPGRQLRLPPGRDSPEPLRQAHQKERRVLPARAAAPEQELHASIQRRAVRRSRL